ncbi:MAG: MATE family efflux transporter [Sporomusaceae bacterium]|nr:MATE family efflux transporter [Sporomusaceae bacterium]
MNRTIDDNPAVQEPPVWRLLLNLAAPLMLSNLFQQLYSTVGAAFVGRYVGSQALAAVGASGYIVLILIYFFIGLSVGASIAVSHAFGARSADGVHKAVHTTAALSLLSGLLLTVAGIAFCPLFLRWMNVPADALPYAETYLTIYFYSMIPMLIYNMGSGVLRAVGDTKTSMYCLAAACACNIALTYLLVAVLAVGIAGAAWATVVSQLLAAVIVTVRLMRSRDLYRLEWRSIKLHWSELEKIVQIGTPAGLQSVLQSFSNLFIQSKFNLFGSGIMAGVTAYCRVEGFIYMPIEGFAMAAAVLAGQSVGAGQYERVRQVFASCAVLCTGVTAGISFLVCWQAAAILTLFTTDAAALQVGLDMLYMLVPLYFIYGMNQVFGGVIRGTGQSRVPMLIVMVCLCLFRVVWTMFAPLFSQEPWGIFICYPLSWGLAWVAFALYYRYGGWLKKYETASMRA